MTLYYSTLRDAKFVLKQEAGSAAAEVALLRCIAFASERVEELYGFEFLPRIDTRRYPYGSAALADLYTLALDEPLLALTTLTNASGGALASTTLYPRNTTPYGAIRLADGGATTYGYNSSISEEITVLGTWGYRKRYGDAWILSGDTVQDNPLSSSATTLNVASVAGVDALQRTPRFSAGQLLRIESEYVIVQSITSNALTIIRGARGSTAAAHVATTPIYVFDVEPVIARAVMVWAGLLYKRLGEYQQAALDLDGKVLTFPKDAPEEVTNILCDFDNETWRRLPL